MGKKNQKFCTHHRRILRNDFFHQPLEENPLFTDIKNLLLIMKAIGLFPFYERVSPCEIARSKKFNAYNSVFLCGIVIASSGLFIYGLSLYRFESWFYSKRDTDISYKGIEIFLNIITYLITILNSRYKSEALLQLVNEILKVDFKIYKRFQTIPNNHFNLMFGFLIGIGMWQAYVMGTEFTVESQSNFWTSFTLTVFYVFENGLIMVFIVFVAVLLRIVHIRLICVNSMIEEYTKKTQEQACCNALEPKGDFSENTLFIFQLHSHLVSIILSINELCTLSLISYMGYAFYTITENTYNIFLELSSDNEISPLKLSWGIFWLILHISLLQLLCVNCDQTIRVANETTKILSRIYSDKKDHRKIVDKFLVMNLKQEVLFVAYGFFNINKSTVFKIFSAVTTYLVILIQFKQLEDAKIESQLAMTTQKEEI